MLKNSLNGLELSRRYYNMYGKPLLDGKWADYKDRITVGLVGEGSECFGFDDEYSTDHDFGPSFCLWLDSKLYDEIGEQLKADYDSLPKSFMGFRARNTIKTGVGRVGVIESGSFYKSILGYDLPKSDDDWHTIPQELLATAVNGEIFKEGSGEFLKIRNEISYYPYHIWIQKLAISLGQMAQTGQVNYKRMLKRNDAFTAELCKNEFVKASIECVYLLNKKYCPYYKWQLKGMESFKTLSDALPLIKEIITLSASDSLLEQKIEELCVLVSRELYDEHLSANCETYLENQKNEVLKING
jgi:hypothetical protein